MESPNLNETMNETMKDLETIDHLETMNMITLIFEGVILSIIGCLGLTANIMAISYFGSSKRRRQTFYGLMLVLAILDLLLIVSCFFLFSLPTISEKYKTRPFYHYTILWVLPVAQMCFTGNTYLTVAVSIERYLTICRPLYHRAHSWKAPMYFVPILAFSILYNVPKFFELGWAKPDNKTQISNLTEVPNYVMPTDLRKNEIYFQVYFVWSNFILNGIVPFVLLITLNVLILNQLRVYGNSVKKKKNGNSQLLQPRIHQHGADERRQAQVHMAKVSIIIVAIFIVCHSIKWVPNIYEMIFVSTSEMMHSLKYYLKNLSTIIETFLICY